MTHVALGTTQQRTVGLTENADENFSAENTLKATARDQPLLAVDADVSNQSLSQGPKKQISGFVPGKNLNEPVSISLSLLRWKMFCSLNLIKLSFAAWLRVKNLQMYKMQKKLVIIVTTRYCFIKSSLVLTRCKKKVKM